MIIQRKNFRFGIKSTAIIFRADTLKLVSKFIGSDKSCRSCVELLRAGFVTEVCCFNYI